ncbi:MAG TPA: molybdenum cofactor biosynthesis protein MoaE [Microthrixaceae bacterium]|nr:molybdenum cofactor biosynthesis protein MoaE [Microthrixaceae bacterium]
MSKAAVGPAADLGAADLGTGHGATDHCDMGQPSPIIIGGLSREPLDPAALIDSVRREDCGGVVVFEGIVRSPNHGHEVIALEYEAWEDKAADQLHLFAREAARVHDLGAALAVHRVGRVEVGEAAVVVVAVAIHRGAAFQAAEELIDRVKSESWIWKKELRVGGEVWIEGCG